MISLAHELFMNEHYTLTSEILHDQQPSNYNYHQITWGMLSRERMNTVSKLHLHK